MTTTSQELRAAAAKLRPSSPAVAEHTAWVKIRPGTADALADWLDSWTGIDLYEAGSLPEDARHALAVARQINAQP